MITAVTDLFGCVHPSHEVQEFQNSKLSDAVMD